MSPTLRKEEEAMTVTQTSTPVGTLGLLGHPANDIRIIKTASGWRNARTLEPVSDEDFKAGWEFLA